MSITVEHIAEECVPFANALLDRGITNLGVEGVVLGIKKFAEERGYCTGKQWGALCNIKNAMDAYPESQLMRYDSTHWDSEDEYFTEDMYGFND